MLAALILSAFVFTGLAWSPAGVSKNQKPAEKIMMAIATKATEHATISVYYPDPCYLSAPNGIKVVIKNTGDKKISYTNPAINQQFTFRIVDQNGKEVPLTRYGRSRPKPTKVELGSAGTIAPGRELSIAFDVQRMFDLTVPGDYKLSVKIDHGLDRPLASGVEVLQLEIEDVPLHVREAPPRVQDEGDK